MGEFRDMLLETIHARAEATWSGGKPTDDYGKWIAHWKATAFLVASEFRNQGLERTALAAEEWGK